MDWLTHLAYPTGLTAALVLIVREVRIGLRDRGDRKYAERVHGRTTGHVRIVEARKSERQESLPDLPTPSQLSEKRRAY